MTLSEPINPALDGRSASKAGEISRNAVKTMPANFPNVEDAVVDFRNAVYGIMNNIIMEYTAMYQDESEKDGGANSPAPQIQGKDFNTTVQSNMTKAQGNQQREIRQQRLEKYLIEFNSSQLYA